MEKIIEAFFLKNKTQKRKNGTEYKLNSGYSKQITLFLNSIIFITR
jgi:hypothetical protein